MLRPLALLLTVLTGFTGLAYEITWQRYMATLLGAHSEATASVLGIFLGGLSLGYWIFGALTRRLVERGEHTGRPPPLLWVYGLVETGIGVYCLLFPFLFRLGRVVSVHLPTGTGGVAFAADVLLAAVLIGPPVVLMGGTIPMLTQGLARSLADATRFHALVYAFNTLGAFAGALVGGFVLVPWLGLDGVMFAMGTVNLVVGGLFVALGRRARVPVHSDAADAKRGEVPLLYAATALLVGFAMMALQATFVRLGGLSLGSSEYTFSMVVAVFVLCIALGSFAVSALPRIGRALLAIDLWLLLLVLLLLYTRIEQVPFWAHVLRTAFRDYDQVFYIYQAALLIALLLAIGPTVVLSGATLPLLFHAVQREAGGLGVAAGRLYGLNTVGSLLGALLGGYVLLFWIDLTDVYRIALVAVGLAAALVTARLHPRLGRVGAVGLFLATLALVSTLAPWRPELLASGRFRQRTRDAVTEAGPDALVGRNEWLFYDDDPVSSVAVVLNTWPGGSSHSIVVNGKSDGNTRGDRYTMRLLALIPALFAERPGSAFVIGWGTGMTAGELAALDEIQRVKVAEISPAVSRAAALFDSETLDASQSPKIEIVESDAYRALLESGESYDIIISEPSNPWVSGVEMLYSREFLESARDHLTPNGVYAQWFHRYSNDLETQSMVLRTYMAVFDHVVVWEPQNPDLLLMGFMDSSTALDLERLEQRMERGDFSAGLARLGIAGLPQLLVHERVPIGVLNALDLEGPLHTLYHPRLSARAARAFFRGSLGELPFTGWGEPARIGAENSLLGRYLARFDGNAPEATRREMATQACTVPLASCGAALAYWAEESSDPDEVERLATTGRVRRMPLLRLFLDQNFRAARRMTPSEAVAATNFFQNRFTHGLPFQPEALVKLWKTCRADESEASRCSEGLRHAQRYAVGGPLERLSAPGLLRSNR